MKKTFLFTGFIFGIMDSAHAGMPSFRVSDMAQMHLSTLSFFIVIYLVASVGGWKVWNALGKDFSKMPQLSFKRALALVFLFGLAFHLVLVMIAGTRELMTPEAWVKDGNVHKVRDLQSHHAEALNGRRAQLEKLWLKLRTNTAADRFPASRQAFGLDETQWTAIDDSLYIYVPDVERNGKMRPLVYESESYGNDRFVLFSNGVVELIDIDSIREMNRGDEQ